MYELTERQEEYLLLMTEYYSNGCSLTEAAAHFGVSKPSAYKFVKRLEEMGYLRRNPVDRAIIVTEAGRAHVGEKPGLVMELSHWLKASTDMTPSETIKQARAMVASLDCRVIDAMLSHWRKSVILEGAKPDLTGKTLANGAYSIDFVMNKANSMTISHGDKGLEKPAILLKTDENCDLLLRPVEVKRHLKGYSGMKGHLKQMWYFSGDEWHECNVENGDLFRLPYESLSASRRDGKWVGVSRVRVRVSLGRIDMPESEADLVFDLSHIAGMQKKSGAKKRK